MAQEREIPVLRSSWVDAVWAAMGGKEGMGGKDLEVKATDQSFLTHVCPVFHNQV